MATAPLGVRLLVGAEAQLAPSLPDSAEDAAAFLALPVSLLGKECLMDSAGNLYARVEALPRAGAAEDALLRAPAGAVVVGSAKRLLALAGAMRNVERLAGGTALADRAEPSLGASTAADMDIDSGGESVSTSRPGGDPGAKRRRGGDGGGDDAPGVFQRPAKRRILAWRVRQYRSLVAKAKATARRARVRATRRRRTAAWRSVQQQLARATLSCDGLHRWSPGGAGGGGGAA